MELKRVALAFLVTLIVECLEIKKYPYELQENDFCGLDKSVYSGKCKKLTKCRNLIAKRKTIEICSLSGLFLSKVGDAIVCCSREDFYASRRLSGDSVLDYEKCKQKYKSLRPTKTEESFHRFVVNGEDVEPYEFPHMAAVGWLSWYDFSVKWNCGGSLITENFVMSAAHCMNFNGLEPNVVRLGDIDLESSDDDAFMQQFGVQKIFIHPRYDVNDNSNDIGLIRLLGSVV